jgi:hypothetical protein
MAMQSTTLRPGLLVSLKTSLSGNVSYDKVTLESAHLTTSGEQRERWETLKTITDPAEQERAEKARSKAAGLVRAVCAHSAFGLLCPESDKDALEAAIAAARKVAEEFNDSAALSRVSVYVITGRIAADDVEAVRAINSEVSGLLETMARGVSTLDVKTIRDAADRAKSVGAMLPAETAARMQVAIDAARSAARQIVKAGETAAQEIDTRAIRRITEARTAFLDLDDNGNDVAAPQETARGIDFEPASGSSVAAVAAPQFAMEL